MKNKCAIILLIVSMIFTNIVAQKKNFEKIDSLKTILKIAKDDSNKVNTIINLVRELVDVNPDTSILLSTQALQLSEKIKWQIGIGKSYNALGSIYDDKGEYIPSLKYYNNAIEIWEQLEKSEINNKSQILKLKAKTFSNIAIVYESQTYYSKALDFDFKSLEIDKKLEDKNGIAIDFGHIGILYKDYGDYPKALDYLFMSLKTFEELGNKEFQAKTLSNIGLVYDFQLDFTNALKYHFKSLKMKEELENKIGIAYSLGNIGNIYQEKGDYANALEYDLKALKIANELGDKYGIAGCLGNLGIIYMNSGDSAIAKGNKTFALTDRYPQALDYFFKALKIVKEQGDQYSSAVHLSNIGTIYIKQNKLNEGDEILHEALKLATEIGALNIVKVDNENLSELSGIQGDWKNALAYYKKSIIARDSLFNQDKTQESMRHEMNYEFSKQQDSIKAVQDKKDTLANAEIGKQKIIRNSIAGGACVIILSSLFIFFFYKRKRDAVQKQKETALSLQVSETEMKALRSQMNPHFIFNALQSIQTFLLSHKPDDANNYLLKFSKLMRLVLENSQHSEVSLKEDMQALELYMQLESIRLPHPFSYEFHIDKSIDAEETVIPPLILQPFVENAIWHGLQYKPEPGKINIFISKKNNTLYATVEDNGVGRDMTKKITHPLLVKKQSLGMKLTKERLKILNELKNANADFKIIDLFTNDNQPAGTKVELSLPLAG